MFGTRDIHRGDQHDIILVSADFLSFDRIPARFAGVYELNPVAALILCLRNLLLTATAPPNSTLVKLTCVSFAVFGVGLFVFRKGKYAFYDHI